MYEPALWWKPVLLILKLRGEVMCMSVCRLPVTSSVCACRTRDCGRW